MPHPTTYADADPRLDGVRRAGPEAVEVGARPWPGHQVAELVTGSGRQVALTELAAWGEL